MTAAEQAPHPRAGPAQAASNQPVSSSVEIDKTPQFHWVDIDPLPPSPLYSNRRRAEKKCQERKARQSTIDFTRSDVVVDGQTVTAPWKRKAILLVVKGIASHRASPEEIAQVLEPIKGRRLFKVVPEETEDPERFRTLDGEAEGRQYADRRWQTDQGDLLVHQGQT